MEKMIVSRKLLVDKFDISFCIFLCLMYAAFFVISYIDGIHYMQSIIMLGLGMFQAWFTATILQQFALNIHRRLRFYYSFKQVLNPKYWIWNGFMIKLDVYELDQPVFDWCNENFDVYCFGEDGIVFKTKSDALKFILRWAGTL